MKAFGFESTDKPASLIDVPKPEMGESDVLIAVRAASINGFDVYQARGQLLGMLEHAFPAVIGRDFAGVVDRVGPGFTDFAQGDEVFGFIPSVPPLKSGSFAEYIVGGRELVLAAKPAELDFNEAAGLPLAGSAALDLLEAIDGHERDVVLIAGATGGVGTLAVQLAAKRGLIVAATARPDDDAFVRKLGASETIDHSAGSLAHEVRSHYPDGVAALIDLVDQKEALTELASVVRPGGQVASLLGAADVELLADRGVYGQNINAKPTAEKLRLLAGLASFGALRVPIQGVYPIERAGEAFQAFEQGSRGKLIVSI